MEYPSNCSSETKYPHDEWHSLGDSVSSQNMDFLLCYPARAKYWYFNHVFGWFRKWLDSEFPELKDADDSVDETAKNGEKSRSVVFEVCIPEK